MSIWYSSLFIGICLFSEFHLVSFHVTLRVAFALHFLYCCCQVQQFVGDWRKFINQNRVSSSVSYYNCSSSTEMTLIWNCVMATTFDVFWFFVTLLARDYLKVKFRCCSFCGILVLFGSILFFLTNSNVFRISLLFWNFSERNENTKKRINKCAYLRRIKS